MLFTGEEIYMTKAQLRALASCVYEGELDKSLGHRPVSGMALDFKTKKACASDGHRLLVAAPDEEHARAKFSGSVVVVPQHFAKAVLKIMTTATAVQFSTTGSSRDDHALSAVVIDRGVRKDELAEELLRDPARMVDKWGREPIAAPPLNVRPPPYDQVMPKIDPKRTSAVSTWACGSDYFAALATIGKAVHRRTAGGAAVRIHLPERKDALDPMVCTIEDTGQHLLWFYVVMPVRL